MDGAMVFRPTVLFLIFAGIAFPAATDILMAQSTDSTTARRKAYLEQIRTLLPPPLPNRAPVSPLDSTWEDWQQRTGELPPDFAIMTPLPFLPDPLLSDEGGANIPITTPAQWRERRAEIIREAQHWFTGTLPPSPNNLTSSVISERQDGAVSRRMVELRFGPGRQGRMTVELLVPPGTGPFPVFMTQWNHIDWARTAVRRGYIGCVYAGADDKDDTDSFARLYYPEYDFTLLARRAWGASRVVDYLHTLAIVDTNMIAMTGHSRNSKQSVTAAAYDERIKAVVPSSGGTGGNTPLRHTGTKYDNETIVILSSFRPNWLHPRLRFFVGREPYLPVDQHQILSAIAPRGLMLTAAITEGAGGNDWSMQHTYQSLQRVYRLLGAEDRVSLRLRHGRHAAGNRDIEAYLDFFDYVFGRSSFLPEGPQYYRYDFDEWRSRSGETVDPLQYPEQKPETLLHDANGNTIASVDQWREKRDTYLEHIRWMLGEEPPGVTNPGPGTWSGRGPHGDDFIGDIIGRPQADGTLGRMLITPYSGFGDGHFGNLYYAPAADGSPRHTGMPAVIFLHEYSYPRGFANGIEPFLRALTARGFAVFCFDQIGFGNRIEEGTRFYERYLHWSKMGRMVADTRAAIDALQNLAFIDGNRMYTVGYSLGGTVGLITAALDARITGTASICGLVPMRLATPDRGYEGIRAFSHLHGLLPRLGFFANHPTRLPVDFNDILAAIAPRPAMIVAPQYDRDAPVEDVRAYVEYARKAYGLSNAAESLQAIYPLTENRFSTEPRTLESMRGGEVPEEVVEWLTKQAGL